MSRLTDLIAQAKAKDAELGKELEREFKTLAGRRSFGLNFERHTPESVELSGRPIRKGDKVRVLLPRGSTETGDQRLWKVVKTLHDDGKRDAQLELINAAEPEAQTVPVEDLIVVAEFRDFIYPGLVSTGKVEHGGGKPYHTVINSENFHALEALTFTHRGKIDAIYIDPPYNTGAKDWKYNNDYVDGEDLYRHSKWLAFMERRLKIARELLKPTNSVLIVTIDEKEYLRLGLLLEQIFPEADVQMVSCVINPKGTARGDFARVDEYIFFVKFGDHPISRWKWDMLSERNYEEDREVRWRGLARTGRKGLRSHNPGSWYPIYIKDDGSGIHSIGDTIPLNGDETPKSKPSGTVEIWPPSKGTQQYSWSVVPETLRSLMRQGAVKTGRIRVRTHKIAMR
ncbi:MAG: site-specific DNA-methyltransferase, partial [Fimbriimonadaceae bacterium]|nr:site-specific DNA-methyltransferase [Alphaproteobacteria bacterium]